MIFIRQNRFETDHHKKGGGGVVTLLRSDLKVKRHSFEEIRILQYIFLEVSISQSTVFLINVYSPFGYPVKSNREFGLLLGKIEPLHIKDDLLIVGDFNMPSVKWFPDPELPGVFVPMGNSGDEIFINTLFDNDLKQIATPPTGRNHLYLTLILNESTSHCSYPINEETLDRSSLRHFPFIL